MAQQNGGSSWTQTDTMVAAAIGGIAGLSLLFWFTGQVGAVLTGHGWPPTDVQEALSVVIGILRRPFNPASAWPKAMQSSIPSWPLYYLIFLILVGGGGYLAYKLTNFFRESAGRNGLGNEKSTWANRNSLKTLVVPGPVRGRLVLGHAQGKLVAAEPRQSCIVMGPSQSGKTTGLAIPAILEWDGPVIATSVKTDLARDTLEWRKKLGRVWVYDPTSSTGLPSSTWSPLDGARTWGGAKKIANWLVSAGQGEKSGLNDAQFWYTAAGKLLGPHLFAAAANGYTMADVVRWIDTQEDFELRALLQATGCEEAIQAAEASWQREERARSSIYTTAEVVIEAYSDPTVLESANTSDIQPETFFDGGMHTLYVCAPGHEQARLRPVFSTLLKQFITAAYEKSSAEGGKPMDPPLLIVLDEAANIAPLSDLDAIASTAAGHGIQLLTVWQDLSQIKARYSDRAQTVINNHRAKVILSGISDTESLDYASRLIGSEEVKQTSYTTDADGRRQKTESRSDKNLAPSDVLRRIKRDEGVLVYGALLPSRLILRPWYKNRVLRARSEGVADGSSAFPHASFDGAGEIGSQERERSSVAAMNSPAPLAVASSPSATSAGMANPWSNPTSAAGQGLYEDEDFSTPIGSRPAQVDAARPDIEDLFDFSDFDDWDDETNDATIAPGSPTAYGKDSERERDRISAAMDEWLKMFPPPPNADDQGGDSSNPFAVKDASLSAEESDSSTREPRYASSFMIPDAVDEETPASAPAKDPEYEEFLAWKREQQQRDAAAAYEQLVNGQTSTPLALEPEEDESISGFLESNDEETDGDEHDDETDAEYGNAPIADDESERGPADDDSVSEEKPDDPSSFPLFGSIAPRPRYAAPTHDEAENSEAIDADVHAAPAKTGRYGSSMGGTVSPKKR